MSLIRILLGIALATQACQGDGRLARDLAVLVEQVVKHGAEYQNFDVDAFNNAVDYGEENVEGLNVDKPQSRAGEEPTVNTTSGKARGRTLPEAHAFYEIPYAEPPVRYQPPVALYAPDADIDATENDETRCMQFEPLCINGEDSFPCLPVLRSMKEDCLVLNVYVPTHVNLSDPFSPPTQRLPVMYYIHGGSFNAGAGTRTSLHGIHLANVTNSIVVTINYRLGALGFLVHEEAGYDDIIGNQGIQDQRLGLQWVQDNIEAFGGDKTKVTLFGNSAGAQSVMFHVVSPESGPLFARAIQQSNPGVFGYQTREASRLTITERLLRSMENICVNMTTDRDCLVNSSAVDICNRQIVVMALSLIEAADIDGLTEPYRPVVGEGTDYPEQPFVMFQEGNWNTDKELIFGVQTQELEDIQFYLPDVTYGENTFRLLNRVIFGDKGKAVSDMYIATYPPDDGNYVTTFGIEMSQLFFICPSRLMARYASNTSTTSEPTVYFYANDHPVLDQTCVGRNNTNDECYYATHADEIRFVFRTMESPGEADNAVMDQFSTYWGSFARTGSPNNNINPSLTAFTEWPPYTATSTKLPPGFKPFYGLRGDIDRPYLLHGLSSNGKVVGPWQNIRIMAPQSEVEVGYEEEMCDFLDCVNYYIDAGPCELPTTTTTTTTTTATTSTTTTTTMATTSTAVISLPGIGLLLSALACATYIWI